MRGRASPQLLWVTCGAIVLVALDLGRRVLSNNDEARFPLLAREMLARGDWFFPQLNGALYHNKPLLFAWLIALVSWPAGHVTQLTAALPSAAAGAFTGLVVYATGKAMFGADTGMFAGLAAVTTQGVFLHARLPMPDMLMTLFIAASLWAFWPMSRGRARAWIAFYVSVGLAFWAKGPAGFLPLAGALVWAVASRQPGRWAALRLPLGLALLAVVVAPWPIIGVLWHPEGIRHAVVDDQVSWFLPHGARLTVLVEPIRNAFGVLFPWVLAVPLVVAQAWRFLRGRGPERDGVLVLVVWSAVFFVAVAVSSQQRLRYYLPLVPPVALLVGWWVAGLVVKRRAVPPMPWRLYAGFAALLVLATAVAAMAKRDALRDVDLAWRGYLLQAIVLVVTAAALAVALHVGLAHRRVARAFAVAWAGSALFLVLGYHADLERRNDAYDYPRLHARVAPFLSPAAVVATWDVADLPLSFYFDRPVLQVATEGTLSEVVAGRAPAVAIVPEQVLARLDDAGRFPVLLRDRIARRPIAVVSNLAPARTAR